MISIVARSSSTSCNAAIVRGSGSRPRRFVGPMPTTTTTTAAMTTLDGSSRVASSLFTAASRRFTTAAGGGGPPSTLFSSRSSATALVTSCLVGCFVGTSYASSTARMEAASSSSSSVDATDAMDDESQSLLDEAMTFLGLASKTKASKDATAEDDDKNTGEGKGGAVVVKVTLETELVDSLPLIPLSTIRNPSSTSEYTGRLLVTYDGIVYDVTEFASHHPGGKDLLLTSVGLDLSHFFTNYAIHGTSRDKVANWLSTMAVGKLTSEDTILSRQYSTAKEHVARRHVLLSSARRKIIIIAATLPLWMSIRACVRWVGYVLPSVGRLLTKLVPVTVPGLSYGAEPLLVMNATTTDKKEGGVATADTATTTTTTINDNVPTVAVIGGGIAGCGTAWSLARSGFRVTLFEARREISGNARTFDWDFGNGKTVKSCCSVTAWPPLFYKNYTCLLNELGIETVHQPLSWFLNSKVPGAIGTLWAADPTPHDGSLRTVLKNDFDIYERVVRFSDRVCNLFTFRWAPWRWHDTPSMYDAHTNLGLLNPLNVVPLYSLFRLMGGSELWWQVVFTPHYTASFLVDELRPFPAVFGPLIEAQIPLLPNRRATPYLIDGDNTQSFTSSRSDTDCNITTCQTWKDAGNGIREVFAKLTKDVDLRENTRILNVEVLPNGKKRIVDEYDNIIDVDRVVFACPANAIGNIHKSAGWLANTIFSTLVYADDHHPDSGHMHAVIHSDGSVIDERYRLDCLKRASNIVEITQKDDGTLNIENQYNFGVQTPGPGVYDMPLDKKPVMLISHALGEGKSINEKLVVGTANHARAHPLYSGWNVMAMLSLRLVQGKDGIYYCSNWTTPGNCHDMSFLSGLVCAHAIGARYPFEENGEAKKDFHRLRDLMGI